MITEVVLVLPSYLILFFIWWRFQPLIKATTDVVDIFDDDFLEDIIDTPKEGIKQHKKRKCSKGDIDKGKTYLLGHKLTHGKVDKASDETIDKTYAEYKQRELNEKYEKKLERPQESMSLICIPLMFINGLRSTMLKNYSKTLKMI